MTASTLRRAPTSSDGETRYITDGLRRRVATRDPAGRTIRQVFTEERDQLIDANGQATTWERDCWGA